MRHISLKSVSARLSVTLLLLMGSMSASAQYYLNVYEKTGSNNQYEISNLDSVSISDVKEYTPVLTQLSISQSQVSLETGESATLTVKGYDADGAEMSLEDLKWKSSDYSVASVDENGVVRTYKSGYANIVALVGDVTDTCVVIIKDHVYTLDEVVKLSLDKVALNVETGDGDSLSVRGFAADGVEIQLSNIQWKTNNSSVATVTNNGVVKTLKSGKALIIASLGDISDTCVVTVDDHVYTLADVVEIAIDKDTLNLETGQNATLSAIGLASTGVEISLKNILWKSSNSSIATIDEDGLIKTIKKGNTIITASFGIISDTCFLVVVDHVYTLEEVVSLTIDKDALNLETGDNSYLSIKGFAADGVEIPLEGVVWESRNISVASVDENGKVSANNKGNTIITASFNGISVSCDVMVKDKFVAIDVTIDKSAESGVYMGVMSFNKQLYTKPISILNTDSKNAFDSFIDGMVMKNGTLLCYSVDNAIDSLGSAVLPDNLSKVAIVTFTDGLDQGSIDMIEAVTGKYYDSDDEYLVDIKRKISTYSLAGIPITAYSVGLRGSDVKDLSKFQSTLKQLASSDEYAIEVQNMSEVNAKFREIAGQLNRSVNYQTVPIVMPGLPNGTRVRFTFDNVADATKSTMFIEGTYNRRDRSLTDVEYHGLSSSSGTVVAGEITEIIFTKFTFESILTDDNSFINKNFINEWYMTSDGTWQINSEFDPDQQPDIEVQSSSILIMLVLDCSSSLGDDFTTAKANAKDFISTMYSATGGDDNNNGSGGDSGNINDNFSIYSKTPIDLSLAVSIDGVRYYLTQEQYEKANLSKAVIEGLTIVFGGESFIIALQDESIGILTPNDALAYYGSCLPSLSQGKIISARWSYINEALKKFGGTALSNIFWTKESFYQSSDYTTYYYYVYSGGGQLSYTYTGANPVRLVGSTNVSSPLIWKDPQDLTLVAYKGKERFNFTKEQWASIINKEEYEKIGILVTLGSEKFIIALENEPIDDLYQSNAITYYGSNLPNMWQGRVIGIRWASINSALQDFNGTKLSNCFWTNYKEYRSSEYCYYYYYICSSGTYGTYTNPSYPIRLVYPNDKYKEHEYVDLGLSVKWATCNVGAYNPEDNGNYYSWGMTNESESYAWTNYSYSTGSPTYSNLTKYCSQSYCGYDNYTDNKTVLEQDDDIAHIKWGGEWRMPTKEEFEELLDNNNCEWLWAIQNGVCGYKVVSKKRGYEGNSIFLPVVGNRDGTSGLYYNRALYYWSSSLDIEMPKCAYCLNWIVNSEEISIISQPRSLGVPVRPVFP